jgi:hypothetical protein
MHSVSCFSSVLTPHGLSKPTRNERIPARISAVSWSGSRGAGGPSVAAMSGRMASQNWLSTLSIAALSEPLMAHACACITSRSREPSSCHFAAPTCSVHTPSKCAVSIFSFGSITSRFAARKAAHHGSAVSRADEQIAGERISARVDARRCRQLETHARLCDSG